MEPPPPAPPSAPIQRTLSAKRASTIQPLDVRRILTTDSGVAAEAKPLPAEHVASPASPSATSTHSMASDRTTTSFQSHSRTMSIAAADYIGGGTPVRTNRFSMTFPVQPAAREGSPHRPGSSSDAVPIVQPEAVASPTGPTDSNFLTAIAAQERRVLELKEELQRAEAELDKLKRQWANHEAHKKKNDARKVTKLQPLNTALASPKEHEDGDGDGSSAWMQQGMERRKALLNGTRTSNRTVFSGSRHARALSLLSPVHKSGSGNFAAPHPPRQDSLASKKKASLERERPQQQRPSMLSRASTTPDMTTEVAETASADIDLNNVDRDVLIKTGKKMASDFKDGLWTFLEDLRQATVGDEATQILPPNANGSANGAVRKQPSTQTLRKGGNKNSSRTSLRPSSRGSTASKASTETTKRPPTNSHRRQSPAKVAEPALVDVNDAFWTEAGLSIPHESTAPIKRASKHTKTPSIAPSVASSIDAWDTWDDSNSPKDSRSSSATSESVTHNIASPRSSKETQRGTAESRASGDDAAREGGKKDPIPWPALAKFGPATLRRTASHLMHEWEKSLTPSPGQEYRGEGQDYLGYAAEARALAPTGSGKKD